jgi:hypothetical protein
MAFKYLTPTVVAGLAALSLLGSGCTASDQSHRFVDHETNFFNLFRSRPASFADTPSYTLDIHQDEMWSHPNASGDQVTLFAGLITYDDY